MSVVGPVQDDVEHVVARGWCRAEASSLDDVGDLSADQPRHRPPLSNRGQGSLTVPADGAPPHEAELRTLLDEARRRSAAHRARRAAPEIGSVTPLRSIDGSGHRGRAGRAAPRAGTARPRTSRARGAPGRQLAAPRSTATPWPPRCRAPTAWWPHSSATPNHPP